MPRFIQYEEARIALARADTLTADELRRMLDVSPQAALSFLNRFASDGLVEMQDEATQRYRVLGRSRRRWGSVDAGTAPSAWQGANTQAEEIARLERELAVMRERALHAEARVAAGPHGGADQSVMHDRLRRVLLRSLHPDAQGENEEGRRVMDELFRTLWPKVRRILDGHPEEDAARTEPRSPDQPSG